MPIAFNHICKKIKPVIKLITVFVFIQLLTIIQKCNSQLSYKTIKNDSISKYPIVRLPINYYTTQFGVICKKELQLEKFLKVPVRIRLGSVEQVDKLEGKLKN
ncbi:MAG: hypothetical protein ACOVNY_00770 [Chitinophagaceae bacterium]